MRRSGLLAFGLFMAAAAPVLAASEVLSPPAVLERTLSSCDEDVYRMWLAPGDVLEGYVRQREVDLVVRVTGPEGVESRRIDHTDAVHGIERFLVIAGRGGEYRLSVRADRTGSQTEYTLAAEPVRRSTEADLTILAAVLLLDEATAIQRIQTDERFASLFASALALCRLGRSVECEAEALKGLAYDHWYSGQELRKGREYLRAAFRIHEASGDVWQQAETLNDLGVLSFAIGDIVEARDSYERVIALPTGDERSPIYLHHLAAVYFQLGEFQRALDLERDALELWKASGDQVGIAYGLILLGEFHRKLGDPLEALRVHQEGLRRRRAIGWKVGIAQSLLGVGQDQEALGDHERAMLAYREALELFVVEKHSHGQALAQQRIGNVLLARGDRERALEAYEAALALFRVAGASEADALKGIGDVHAARGEAPAAIASYRKALETYRASGNPSAEVDVQLAMAQAELGRDQVTTAKAILDTALESLESRRYSLVSPDQRASYLAARQTFYDLAVDARMRMHGSDPRAGHDKAALEVSEGGRARALRDSLSTSGMMAEVGVDPTLLARELALRSRIGGKAAAIAQSSAQKRDASEAALLREELESLLAAYREVEGELRRASPRLALQAQPLSIAAIQAQLDPDVLLLEYALGESRSYVWLVTSEGVTSAELAPRREIEGAARELAALLPLSRKREVETQTRRAAARLSRLILAPIASHLVKRRLVIVPDGALQYVPFGVLPDPHSRPLLLRHELVSLPSASVIAELRQLPPSRAKGIVAVMADPVLTRDDPRLSKTATQTSLPSDLVRSLRDFSDLNLARLPHTRREAMEIANLAGGESSLQALDFAATRARAMSGELSDYRIVHFATHGLINAQHPELSGLVLSLVDERGQPQDGFLRLLDIYRLRLDAELVVLSACRTALGHDVRREGLVGLARGFMLAGSPRVVATLWDVRDSATAELMKRFYRHLLLEKMTPAAALRAAQLSMLREPRWSAPFYWGAFVLQGEWR